MTFFRHFCAKEQLLLEDPYDPLIAAAVGAQPRTLDALARTVRGLRQAWEQLREPEEVIVRRRVRITAQTPTLRAPCGATTPAPNASSSTSSSPTEQSRSGRT